jgi:hypothetical protein
MTRRISTPRCLTVIGKKRAMISQLTPAAGRDAVSGIGTFERYTDAGIAQVDTVDNGIQSRSGFDL